MTHPKTTGRFGAIAVHGATIQPAMQRDSRGECLIDSVAAVRAAIHLF